MIKEFLKFFRKEPICSHNESKEYKPVHGGYPGKVPMTQREFYANVDALLRKYNQPPRVNLVANAKETK